jgi:hypothetical protein
MLSHSRGDTGDRAVPKRCAASPPPTHRRRRTDKEVVHPTARSSTPGATPSRAGPVDARVPPELGAGGTTPLVAPRNSAGSEFLFPPGSGHPSGSHPLVRRIANGRGIVAGSEVCTTRSWAQPTTPSGVVRIERLPPSRPRTRGRSNSAVAGGRRSFLPTPRWPRNPAREAPSGGRCAAGRGEHDRLARESAGPGPQPRPASGRPRRSGRCSRRTPLGSPPRSPGTGAAHAGGARRVWGREASTSARPRRAPSPRRRGADGPAVTWGSSVRPRPGSVRPSTVLLEPAEGRLDAPRRDAGPQPSPLEDRRVGRASRTSADTWRIQGPAA